MVDTAWKFRYVSQHERFCEMLEVLCRYVGSGQSRGIQDDFRMLLRMVETYQIQQDKMLQMGESKRLSWRRRGGLKMPTMCLCMCHMEVQLMLTMSFLGS